MPCDDQWLPKEVADFQNEQFKRIFEGVAERQAEEKREARHGAAVATAFDYTKPSGH